MAKPRSSSSKREREFRKRERDQLKRDKAALKRQQREDNADAPEPQASSAAADTARDAQRSDDLDAPLRLPEESESDPTLASEEGVAAEDEAQDSRS